MHGPRLEPAIEVRAPLHLCALERQQLGVSGVHANERALRETLACTIDARAAVRDGGKQRAASHEQLVVAWQAGCREQAERTHGWLQGAPMGESDSYHPRGQDPGLSLPGSPLIDLR